MTTIGIAMSGGVDSSVSAAILREKGMNVHGFFMRLPVPRVGEHVRRVREVAARLDIPLTVVDMEREFSRKVLRVFIETYRLGQTPNPCVICNRAVKFGALLERMKEYGMEKIATGHYARIGRTGSGRLAVRRGADPAKDQSYFLCRLEKECLAAIEFPLGDKTKEEVRKLAARLGLAGVHGPESQDVCFLAGRTLDAFFADQGIREDPGEIVTTGGRVIGRHQGLFRYTIGQRRGLGLPDETPWYVVRLDARNNRVIVAKKEELLTSRALVVAVRWLDGPVSPWEGLVQIRGRQRPTPARVKQVSPDAWEIVFEEKQRAVTPGQFAAFYDGDIVCGSGVLTEFSEQ
ncbi:MAG: tRNA 2-thiouridine(34) synthase MnmA [Desulfobulbaceae bacterium]